MTECNICHHGVIKAISGKTLFVEMERSAACMGCHTKSACVPHGKKNHLITIEVEKPEAFQVNETIQVGMKKSLLEKTVIIAYLLPFIVLVLGLFITYYITKNELLSVSIAFISTTCYYLFLKRIEHKLKNVFAFFASKIS